MVLTGRSSAKILGIHLFKFNVVTKVFELGSKTYELKNGGVEESVLEGGTYLLKNNMIL